ncbi:MAG: response regulator transcription factor [Enterococcus sp.]
MEKILVVEDTDEINGILCQHLGTYYEVQPAFSGTEALLYFQQKVFDLVLLDIMLPGKNGEEVLREIRKSSTIPIIMLTALGDKKKVSQVLLDGADDYITKPFDLDEVLARITVQLRNGVGNSNQEIAYWKCQDIILDTRNFTLRKENQEIRLRKKEFAIFKILVEHPEQIFTKEKLYEMVWQESYLTGDNTLNTHLSNLRKKIAQVDDSREYIETIWGLGVRIKGVKG